MEITFLCSNLFFLIHWHQFCRCLYIYGKYIIQSLTSYERYLLHIIIICNSLSCSLTWNRWVQWEHDSALGSSVGVHPNQIWQQHTQTHGSVYCNHVSGDVWLRFYAYFKLDSYCKVSVLSFFVLFIIIIHSLHFACCIYVQTVSLTSSWCMLFLCVREHSCWSAGIAFTVLLLGIPWKTEFYTEVNSILQNLELFNCAHFSGIPCFFYIHGPYQRINGFIVTFIKKRWVETTGL
jgi:hypothetical protein